MAIDAYVWLAVPAAGIDQANACRMGGAVRPVRCRVQAGSAVPGKIPGAFRWRARCTLRQTCPWGAMAWCSTRVARQSRRLSGAAGDRATCSASAQPHSERHQSPVPPLPRNASDSR
jgi:hypothetical protein